MSTAQILSYVIPLILFSLGNAAELKYKATNQDDRILNYHHTYPRVIGGTFVPIDEYPWFARATKNHGTEWDGCGGSLVSPSFVLTAAHCVIDNAFTQYDGYDVGSRCYGKADINEDNCGQSGNEYRKADWVWMDPKYNKDVANDYDYALVRLSSPINTIDPVAMNAKSAIPNGGQNVIGMGFGATDVKGSEFSRKLLHVTLDTLTPAACKSKWGVGKYGISPRMVCATRERKDTCFGDSGGPLITESEPHQLVGITSFGGKECADRDLPGVYARVSARYEKLKEVICENTPSNHPKASFCPGEPPPTIPPTGSPSIPPTGFPSIPPTGSSVSAPVSDEPILQMPEECKGKKKLLTVKVKTDNNPEATRLTVKRKNKDNVFTKNIVEVVDFEKNKVTIITRCVNTKKFCYKLRITDKQEYDIQNGKIKMRIGGKTIYSKKFKSGEEREKMFGAC